MTTEHPYSLVARELTIGHKFSKPHNLTTIYISNGNVYVQAKGTIKLSGDNVYILQLDGHRLRISRVSDRDSLEAIVETELPKWKQPLGKFTIAFYKIDNDLIRVVYLYGDPILPLSQYNRGYALRAGYERNISY